MMQLGNVASDSAGVLGPGRRAAGAESTSVDCDRGDRDHAAISGSIRDLNLLSGESVTVAFGMTSNDIWRHGRRGRDPGEVSITDSRP
jgi:hypothetical protein